MGPDELFQRAVIARRYYLEGRTRVEIAEEFGLSRFKVARMLEEALETGMVEITVHDPGIYRPGVVDRTATRILAAPRVCGRRRIHERRRQGGGGRQGDGRPVAVDRARPRRHRSRLRQDDDPDRAIPRSLPRCDVVQLTGLAGAISSNGADLTRRISEITGGTSWPLYAPLVVSDARTAKSLASSPQIQATCAQHAHVTCALVSVGAWGPDTSQVYTSLPLAEATG